MPGVDDATDPSGFRCRPAPGAPEFRLECADTSRQPGEAAGRGVPMQDALADAAMDLRLGRLVGRRRGLLVAALDRLLDRLNEGPDAADTIAVYRRPADRLTDAFLC